MNRLEVISMANTIRNILDKWYPHHQVTVRGHKTSNKITYTIRNRVDQRQFTLLLEEKVVLIQASNKSFTGWHSWKFTKPELELFYKYGFHLSHEQTHKFDQRIEDWF